MTEQISDRPWSPGKPGLSCGQLSCAVAKCCVCGGWVALAQRYGSVRAAWW